MKLRKKNLQGSLYNTIFVKPSYKIYYKELIKYKKILTMKADVIIKNPRELIGKWCEPLLSRFPKQVIYTYRFFAENQLGFCINYTVFLATRMFNVQTHTWDTHLILANMNPSKQNGYKVYTNFVYVWKLLRVFLHLTLSIAHLKSS